MKFFFNNYKTIFHTIGILIVFTMFFIFGFKNEMRNPLFDIFLLAIAYFVANFALKTSGLNELADQYYRDQKEKSEK